MKCTTSSRLNRDDVRYNKMKNFFLTLIFLAFTFLFSASIIGQTRAAFLKFDQAAFSGNVGNTIQVQVIVDAGSDQISSTDAYVLYDPTLL